MFLTRSIRRKLVIGLALVCLMLSILAFAGLTGLMSYREVVQDLEFSQNREPRRMDLAVTCAGLFDPLLVRGTVNFNGNPLAAARQGVKVLGFADEH